MMKGNAVTRRTLLKVGVAALASAAISTRAHAQIASGQRTEEIVRQWYKAWEQREWGPLDALLADDFTFTSANGDDHISKGAFKESCWETQKNFIHHFDIEQLFAEGNDAFVKYLCHTMNGKTFRNVEYIRTRESKVAAIECYFGGSSSFATAASAAKN